MRARVCFLKMTEDPWSTEVAIQHPLPGAGLIDDSGSATSNPPVAIRRGRRLSPTFISPGRLCCQPEYHRYHVALVSVVTEAALGPPGSATVRESVVSLCKAADS